MRRREAQAEAVSSEKCPWKRMHSSNVFCRLKIWNKMEFRHSEVAPEQLC